MRQEKIELDILSPLYFRADVIEVIIFPSYFPNKARQLKSFRMERKIANDERVQAGIDRLKNMY
jgi:hypothetical protein